MTDLSKSLVLAIVKGCGGEVQATEVIKGIKEQSESEKQRKIRDLSKVFQFKDNQNDVLVLEALKSTNWDVEKAIAPLMAAMQKREQEAKEEEKRRKREDEEKDTKKVQARKEANLFLSGLFGTISAARIQEVLDQHDGDVEEATDALLTIALLEQEKREQKAKKSSAPPTKAETKSSSPPSSSSASASSSSSTKLPIVAKPSTTTPQSTPVKKEKEYKAGPAAKEISKSQEVCHAKMGGQHSWKNDECVECGLKQNEKKALEVITPNASILLMTSRTPPSTPTHVTTLKTDDAKAQFKKDLAKALRNGPMPFTAAAPLQFSPSKGGPVPEESGKVEEQKLQHLTRPKIARKRGKANLKFQAKVSSTTPTTETKSEQTELEEDESPSDFGFDVVETSSFTLHASPPWLDFDHLGYAPVGQMLKVEWEALADTISTTRDWIGLHRLDSFPGVLTDVQRQSLVREPPLLWNWTNGGVKDDKGEIVNKGQVNFPIPTAPGLYVFQHYTSTSAGSTCTAISNTILVGPRFSLTASLPSASSAFSSSSAPSSTSCKAVVMPARICIRCKQAATSTGSTKFGSGAWVGLYRRDDKDGSSVVPKIDNKNYFAFEWLSNGKDITSTPSLETPRQTEKEVALEVPKAGQWYIRLFADKSYNDVTTTSLHIPGEDKLEVKVEGTVMTVMCSVSTVDPARDYVWVGVYKVEEKDQRQYRRYKYLASSSTTPASSCPIKLTFKAPIHSGTYEARLFANGSYEVISRSVPITIHGI